MITVAQIGQVFVKGTQFLHPTEAALDSTGIRYDRDFLLLEEDGDLIRSSPRSGRNGEFFPLRFTFDAARDALSLELPDGRVVDGPAGASGAALSLDFLGLRAVAAAVVDGPWSELLSNYAGRPLRLARCVHTGAALDILPITLVTTGSLRRLERELGAAVNPSRFRAGLVLDNSVEHEEDGWNDRAIRVGAAVLRVRSPVPRCLVTGLHPTGGKRDQDVMKALIRYRDKTPLPDGIAPDYRTPGFASYAEVIEPGTVQVGDTVELLP